MSQPPQDLHALGLRLARFVEERDWAQFHTPKNLALSVMIEAAELGELFQWCADDGHARAITERAAVAAEMADVLLYLLRLAQVLEIDLLQAAGEKLEHNARKYPVALARGRSDKYDRL
jgi:dCTP diphosphatase